MEHNYIVFYDGVCHLCNGLVQFVLKFERQQNVSFAQLQSNVAKNMIPNLVDNEYPSVIFFNKIKDKFYTRSSAVIQLFWFMGGFWKIFAFLLWLVPRPLRNLGYRIVAYYRYKIFGRSDVCFLQPKSSRFINDL